MKKWDEKSRQEWIRRRKKEPGVWRWIHRLGSLQMAVLLLITIALACAVATIYESKFNARIARAYIYDNPLFILWLGVLCVNLAAAAITRWPWQRKHVGFIITHGGIIVLLVGAVIGQIAGFEAGLTLHKGSPSNQLVKNRTILQATSPADGAVYTMPFEVDLRPPIEGRPKIAPLPGTDMKLVVDEYAENLTTQPRLVSATADAGSAIELVFRSSMMQQDSPVLLAASPPEASVNEFFGQARIELLPELPPMDAVKSDAPSFRESQMIVAGRQPVIQTHEGEASGVQLTLLAENGPPRLRVDTPVGERAEFAVHDVMNEAVQMAAGSLQVHVAGYWPDLVMEDGQPATRSMLPQNPAVLVHVSGQKVAPDALPAMQLAVTDAGAIAYRLLRGGVPYAEGVVEKGGFITPGWADWRAEVREVLQNGVIESRLVKAEKGGAPGIHVALRSPDGSLGPAQWLVSGEPRMISKDGREIRVGFGLETMRVPFAIELLAFSVPRDEGTDRPADFISRIRFHDFDTGATRDATIRMNHPATYPGGWWSAVTGLGYKFSQASWNPENLEETTLQVLHDPGWSLKWIGSLLVCSGIAAMFYFTPRAQRKGARANEKNRRSPAPEPERVGKES